MAAAIRAAILRGQIWAVDLGLPDGGEKFHVVLSTNARNLSGYPWIHAVRLTARKPSHQLPTDVELPAGLPYSGWAKCDELMPVRRDRFKRRVGVLPPAELRRIETGLRTVLGL